MRHKYNTCDLCGKKMEEHPLYTLAAIKNFSIRKFARLFYKVDICENCNRKLGKIEKFADMIDEANGIEIDRFMEMNGMDERYKVGYADGLSTLYDRIKQML